MRILIDENAPKPLIDPLRHVLRGHEVTHVVDLGWSGKKDIPVLRDAAAKGYQVFVTKDSNQLDDPDETDAIKKSKMHHVRFAQPQARLPGLALAMGAVLAAMPLLVAELETAPTQRLVQISGLDPLPSRRFKLVDPRKDPPRYWRA